MKLNTVGGLSGAASGAALGSAILPGVGTAIGAVGGGLLGLFSGKKKKKKAKKVSTLDPSQQRLYQAKIDALNGKGPFGDLYKFDQDAARKNFEQTYAKPAYQNFQEGIVPGITGSFRGQNLQNSSYLGGALSKAGTDVQRGLDAQLANLLYQGQQSSMDRRSQGLNDLLNMQTFAYDRPQQQQPSATNQFFDGFSSAAGKYAGEKLFDNNATPAATPTNTPSQG